MKTLGIDLGGTKIAIGIVENGNILVQKQLPTPRINYKTVLHTIISEAKNLLFFHKDVVAVGLGLPGIIDYKSGKMLFASNLPFMQNASITKDIEEALGYPVFIENDAKAAGFAEHLYGAAKDLDSSMFITISTGIGGGIFIGDKIIRGHHGTAGEVGHIPIKFDGPKCSCGGRGCWEAMASGTAISKSLSLMFEQDISTKEVFALAKKDNIMALTVINNAAEISGQALAILQKIFDPEVFVIGGGVSKVGTFYLNKLQKAANYYSENFPSPLIIAAQLSTNAGLIGAAAVAEVAMKKLYDRGIILTDSMEVEATNYTYKH